MRRCLRFPVWLPALALLAACELSTVDTYPTPPVQQIKLAPRPAVLLVAGGNARGELTPADRLRVAHFFDAFREGGRGRLSVIIAGSSRPTAERTAATLTALAIKRGLPEVALAFSTTPGPTATITLSYIDAVAISPTCQVEKAFAHTWTNETSPNFGCALEGGIAAIIANPADLESVNPLTAPDATRLNKVVNDFRQGKPTPSQEPAQAQGGVSKIGGSTK